MLCNVFLTPQTLSCVLSTPSMKVTRGSPLALKPRDQVLTDLYRSTNVAGQETASPVLVSMMSSETSQSPTSMHLRQNMIGRETASPAPLPKTHPFLAMPSDIYRDFEKLKSATRMDTTELMRKLIQDYTRYVVVDTEIIFRGNNRYKEGYKKNER